ncbi:hypothetical protein EU524_00465 [Candidatus Thorarchaeota archaeon]|nr:MAG: hypothetical protein EU524_00465 [Candidatus Thorarchaeota archaeon]
MNGNPQIVIDEYLTLVRERLPESVADDVINELRSYMAEMAVELGGGEITLESAKKTVARFGSPGEVADEYRYSLFPELLPEESSGTPESETETPYTAHRPVVEVPRKPVVHSQSDPIEDRATVLAKFTGITVFLGTLVVLLSTIVGPLWVSFEAISVFAAEIATAILLGIIRVMYLGAKGTPLWKKNPTGFSSLQRAVTLPENVGDTKSGILAAWDAVGSGFGIVIIVFPLGMAYGILYTFIVSFPASLFLGAKIYYDLKLMRGQNPYEVARRDFLCTMASLVLVNSALAWWALAPPWMAAGGHLGLAVFNLTMGPLYMYQLVTRFQDLWWESEVIKPKPKTHHPALKRLKRAEVYALGKSFVGLILFSILPLYAAQTWSPYYSRYYTSQVGGWFIVMCMAVPVVLLVHYLYRRAFIHRFNSENAIGRRTLGECATDFIVASIFFLVFGFMVLFPLPHEYTPPFELGAIDRQVFVLVKFSAMLFLVAGTGARAIADAKGCRRRSALSSHTDLAVASVLILLGCSGLLCIRIMEARAYGFIGMSVDILLGYALALVLSLQAALSWERAKELTRREPEIVHTTEITPSIASNQ